MDNLSVLGPYEIVTGQALCKANHIKQVTSDGAVWGG